MAAPSARTKPLRVRSKGREACSGSSLRAVVALMASKEATTIGVIGVSDAPASMTSALPSRITWQAWPTESMPEVQPLETIVTGPSAATVHATSAGIALGAR